MKIDIITIFPSMFDSYLKESILGRAEEKKLISIKTHNLRDYALDKHKKVDDIPYGGGPGMVMKAEPIARAVEKISKKYKVKTKSLVIIFSPAGAQFTSALSASLVKKYKNLILIAGRYEGIDSRLPKVLRGMGFAVQELSIGPYVLTGGELPAMVVIDALSRHIPGVLGKSASLEETRGGSGLPAYTRPETFIYKNKKYIVPKVLLSGNHKKIEEWRQKMKP